MLGIPSIVHVTDHYYPWYQRVADRLLAPWTTSVVTVSHSVARTSPMFRSARLARCTTVIHNAIDLEEFAPAEPDAVRRLRGSLASRPAGPRGRLRRQAPSGEGGTPSGGGRAGDPGRRAEGAAPPGGRRSTAGGARAARARARPRGSRLAAGLRGGRGVDALRPRRRRLPLAHRGLSERGARSHGSRQGGRGLGRRGDRRAARPGRDGPPGRAGGSAGARLGGAPAPRPPEERARLAANARRASREYGIERHVAALEALYRRVAAEGRAS